MQNAYKMYWTTANSPSPESVRRAKELPPPQVHPEFANLVPEEEKAKESFLGSLKNFRPPQTILELTGKNAKTLGKEQLSVMKAKRQTHKRTLEARGQPRGGDRETDDSSAVDGSSSAKRARAEADESSSTAAPGRKKEAPASFQDESYFMSAVPSDRYAEAGY